MTKCQIDLSTYSVQTCVYVPVYKFKKCDIRSCKNWSEVTKTSCLAVDRAQPVGNKVISDAEIHLFKFNNTGVTGRLVAAKRKRAVTRIKSILTLHAYITWIHSKFQPEEHKFYRGKYIERAEFEYPLKISRIGFKNWMWPHIVNKDVYKQFLGKKEGDCTEIELHHMLDMTDLKFNTLAEQVKAVSKPAVTQPSQYKQGPKNECNRNKQASHTRRLRSV